MLPTIHPDPGSDARPMIKMPERDFSLRSSLSSLAGAQKFGGNYMDHLLRVGDSIVAALGGPPEDLPGFQLHLILERQGPPRLSQHLLMTARKNSDGSICFTVVEAPKPASLGDEDA